MRDTGSKRHFKKILISYFVVLFVPILVSHLFAWNSTVTVADKSRKIARMTLERRSASLDAIFSELYSIAGAIATNENVQLYIGGGSSQSALADAGGKVAQTIRNARTLSDAIVDILVYNIGDRRIVTCSGRYQDNLSDDLLANMGFGGVDMREFIYSHLTDTAVILESGDLYVMRPLLTDMRVRGAVFILVSDSKLHEVLNDSELLSGRICIASKSGCIYPSEANLSSGENSYLDLPFLGGDVTVELPSAVSSFTYILNVSYQSYLGDVDRVVLFIIVYNLLALAAGGVLAYMYAQRSYMPIKQIIKTVGAGNASLETMLNDIEYRFRKYRTYDAEHSERVRSRMLLGLLRGEDVADARILTTYDIDGNSELAVLAVSYEDIKGTLFCDCELTVFEQRDIINVIIRSITEELLEEAGRGCVVASDDETACILSVRDWSKVMSIMERASMIIEDNFGLLVIFGASSRISGAADLPAAYREALCSLDYAILHKGSKWCVLYEHINTTAGPADGNSRFVKEYHHLLSALIEKNFSRAADCLERIRSDFGTWSAVDIKRRCWIIASTAAEFGIYDVTEDTAWRTQDVQGMFSSIYGALSAKQSQKEGMPQSDLVRRAIKYIDKHYTEYSLDILRISDAMGVSQSHLSREFKREVGMTLTDYIRQQRLHEAKRLLTSDKLSIKDISLLVGYPDPRALNRIFRQAEGFTAAEYRKYIRSLRNSD